MQVICGQSNEPINEPVQDVSHAAYIRPVQGPTIGRNDLTDPESTYDIVMRLSMLT